MKIVTLPYADDFCIISNNKVKHQKMISDTNDCVEEIGMRLKPSKCRSFSIQKGKPTINHFNIGNKKVPSIQEEEQKFLGKVLFFQGKQSQTYEYIKKEMEKKIKHVHETKIRNEFKLWIYQNYVLPATRFILPIHDITKTDLSKLDNMTHRYIKIWGGLPGCATNSIFHHQNALNVPMISELYKETHVLNYTNTKLKGDELVNHALNMKVDRESELKRITSAAVEAKEIFEGAVAENSKETKKTCIK